jgi:DNA polymerase-4
VSVDEAYLDVTAAVLGGAVGVGQDEALDLALPLARAVKERIRAERGLTASVGIASNKFLAKLASDHRKPDGLMVIHDRDRVEFLRPLPVGTVHGVGPVTARRLEAAGVRTVGDLQDSTADLRPVLGFFADKLKQRAFGIDERELDLCDERKSVSAENTFAEDTEDRAELRAALREMAADVAGTLERHGVGALTIQVKVRYTDFTTLTRQIRMEEPVAEAREIYRMACYLLARHRLVTGPLRLLGVGASTLVPRRAEVQLRLPLESAAG